MKTHFKSAVLLMALLASACNNSVVPTTPTPTFTPSPRPTNTRTPTSTPSPIPPTATAVEIPIVPRWMLISQPYYSVMIARAKWNYKTDNWGKNAACIDYVRESESYMFFEQCFAVAMEGQDFESILEPFVENDFETLQPKTMFDGVEKISLVAKTEAGNKKHFFEILQIKGYILLVEMKYVTESNSSLQSIYNINAAYTMDYLFSDSLQKAHLIPLPAPTPIAKNQQVFYEAMSPMLISHAQANESYYGTWDVLGDYVSDKGRQVCRIFEDRTNEDVLWVRFTNCILDNQDYSLEEIAKSYQSPQVVTLESTYTYDEDFVLYAFQNGHTFFDAYLQSGDYIYSVRLESRTIASQTPEDVFSQNADDFIHAVLLENTEK